MIWPVCKCHALGMSRNGPDWRCKVRKRARELRDYHAMSESRYARRRQLENVALRRRLEARGV